MSETERDPELPAPVIGFRTWRLVGDKLCATGRLGAVDWPVGDYRAICRAEGSRDPHSVPGRECRCGIYARHSMYPIGPLRLSRLVGVVVAWGEMELHHHGFRAEWARPVLLVVDEDWSEHWRRRVRAAAKRYGLDLVPRQQLWRAAAEHGDPVPRRLLPVDPAPTMLRALQGTLLGSAAAPRLVQRNAGDRAFVASTLITANGDLVLAEARRSVTAGASFTACLQAGALGLLHAAERAGPDYSRFSVEAAWWIRQAIHNAGERGLLKDFTPLTTTHGELDREMTAQTSVRYDLTDAPDPMLAPAEVARASPEEEQLVLHEVWSTGRREVVSWWLFRLGEQIGAG